MIKKLKNTILFALAVTLFSSISFTACIDENISTDPSLRLAFSSDTLFFDTIFSTIGSSTARIKVYNPNTKNVKISAIELGSRGGSPYRINVDGVASTTNQFTNIELRAKDSLFIFVDVTIDPQDINTPVFVKDSILFLTNNNRQNIKLLAYGQDMEILSNRKILSDSTLTAAKPYLIYGDLVVDTAKTLTLEPGCRLYFNDSSNLVVDGNLIAVGTPDAPILMRGIRTDRIFEDVPYNFVSNQWGSVVLRSKEGRHKLEYVHINSGYAGVFFSNRDLNYSPTLEIKNSRIHNFLKYGLAVQNGDVTVINTEISNTGAYSVYLSGGKHTFIHSTIANYFNSSNILLQPSGREGNAAVVISELERIVPMKTQFLNCVISGSNSNEFEIMSRFADRYNGVFSNSYIRKEKPDPIPHMYNQVTWHNDKDTVFVNTFFDRDKLMYYSFMLDSVSPARDIGDIDIASNYPIDLNGNDRTADGKPDAGAYEWQPKK